MQQRVLREQRVVGGRRLFVRRVDVPVELAHRLPGCSHIGVGAGGDGRVDGRAERWPLVARDGGDRHPQDVAVGLHEEAVPQQPAGDDELGDRHPARVERLDDGAGAERGGLEQGPVDLFRASGEGRAEHEPGELVVDEHGAVAAVPVEGDEPVAADRLVADQLGEVLVHAQPGILRGLVAARRNLVGDVPGEDVADAGLAGLIAVEPGDDAAVDDAAHAGDFGEVVGIHHLAGRGAHDRDHLAGLDRLGGGGGDVGVDVADGHGDAFRQAGPGCGLHRQGARGCPEPADLMGHLLVRELGERGVEGGEELLARVGAVLQDALVPGGARVPHVVPGELPDDPVGGLHPVVHPVVQFGVFLEQLQTLGELPLARDESAVARQPALAPAGGQLVDAVGLALRGVVLPQLHIGVRPVGVLGQFVQGRAVGEHRHHGASGEVGADADHERRIDTRGSDRGGHSALQHGHIVRRNLQRPLGREDRSGGGEDGVHHGVRVVEHGRSEFDSVGDAHDDSATGQGPVVDPDDVALVACLCRRLLGRAHEIDSLVWLVLRLPGWFSDRM